MRRLLALSGAIAIVSILALATPAYAHNYVLSSNPAADSTIGELPQEFSVTTNGPLLVLDEGLTAFALQVVGPDGLYYGDGCIGVEGATLSMPATIGEPGAYTVLWQLISEDGHPVSGEFGFTWAPDASAQPSRGSVEPPVCGADAPEPTASATAAPEPQETPVAAPEPAANLSDVLWVGGGVVAVLATALVTLLVVTPKRPRA